MEKRLDGLAADVSSEARSRKLMIATAESCTGGLVAAALTAIAGSSEVFERGFVTYSNAAKAELLGVDPELILSHGAVSSEVARSMAEGALANSKAHLAVSITGIAGPGGGSEAKPVGLVYIATAKRIDPTREKATFEVSVREYRFADGGRDSIRQTSVIAAHEQLLAAMASERT